MKRTNNGSQELFAFSLVLPFVQSHLSLITISNYCFYKFALRNLYLFKMSSNSIYKVFHGKIYFTYYLPVFLFFINICCLFKNKKYTYFFLILFFFFFFFFKACFYIYCTQDYFWISSLLYTILYPIHLYILPQSCPAPRSSTLKIKCCFLTN